MKTERNGTPRSRRARRGFTLIEIMIVIAIIVALGALIGINLFAQRDEAKKGTVKIQMQQIAQGLRLFRLEYDRYPTDQEGLAVLWSKETLDADAPQDKWKKFVEQAIPTDGWGQPWGYRQVSEHGDESTYDLWSNGPDKQEGTEDDITSWTAGDSGTGGTGGGAEPPPPSRKGG
jgi:general secretion pathway protein G